MEWYYQLNGGREGPVDEATLFKLYDERKVSESTMVWNEKFDDTWKPLSQAGLILPVRATRVPPPLPPREAVSPPEAEIIPPISVGNVSPDSSTFLSSPVTAEIVGKNFDTYRPKWERLFAKAGGDINVSAKKVSWNWAAFFFNTGWLFYRKLYILGAICAVIQLSVSFLIGKSVTGAAPFSFVLSLVVGMFGNSLYLQKVWKLHQTASNIHDQKERTIFVSKQGQTNIGYGLLAYFGVIIVGAIFGAASGSSYFENDAACSSDETVKLVKQIVINQMNKENLGIILDMSRLKLDVDAIRTNTSTSKKSTCAAEVDMKIKVNTAMFSGPNNAAPDQEKTRAAEEMMSNKMKQYITYTSEYTDKGDSIYVTVEGMNFNVQ